MSHPNAEEVYRRLLDLARSGDRCRHSTDDEVILACYKLGQGAIKALAVHLKVRPDFSTIGHEINKRAWATPPGMPVVTCKCGRDCIRRIRLIRRTILQLIEHLRECFSASIFSRAWCSAPL